MQFWFRILRMIRGEKERKVWTMKWLIRYIWWLSSKLNLYFHYKLQNGQDECELNSLETCGLNVWNDVVSDLLSQFVIELSNLTWEGVNLNFSYKTSDIYNQFMCRANNMLWYCFEFLAIEGRHKNWQDRFSQLDLPEEPVLNCYIRGNGTEVILLYIYITIINQTNSKDFL